MRNAASLCVVAILCSCGLLHSQEWKPYQAAIHVHSKFSNGHYTVLELARAARERGIDVLVLTDSFLSEAAYCLPPLDRLSLKGLNRVGRSGVRAAGVGAYLRAVDEAQREVPEVLLLAGVEVAPYYYWTGNPWSGLVLHDFDRHLLVLGLGEEDLANLPVVGNETWRNTRFQWSRAVPPALIFLAGLALLATRRRRRVRLRYLVEVRRRRPWSPALAFMAVGLLFLWNNYPFGRLSDPNSGRHQVAPFQRLIDYVSNHGGVVYWAYPEAQYPAVEQGGARMVSRPHPEDLLATDGYDGFEGIYGDRITVTRAAGLWDHLLQEYLRGVRERAPRVITGIDFHYFFPGRSRWYELDGGLTVLLMHKRSRQQVLEALRRGRAYATFQGGDARLDVRDFSVTSRNGSAVAGQTLATPGPVQVRAEIRWKGKPPQPSPPFRLEVIRNGERVGSFSRLLPIRVAFEETLPEGTYYYRIQAASGGLYRLLSNPIFVKVSE